MQNDLPNERQTVEVSFTGNDWQPATFRHGQFVDRYGLPLDREKIADWRASDLDLDPAPPRHAGWTQP